jgi:hypothetical protein
MPDDKMILINNQHWVKNLSYAGTYGSNTSATRKNLPGKKDRVIGEVY